MISHEIRVYPSAETPERTAQFAWKIAALAADPVPIEAEVAGMVINRIIDNAAVAMAAINRRPVANARAQALAHPRQGGATVFGLPGAERFEAEWAGWANATAVRELDFHDTFFGAESAHPGDNISALIAVAQQCDRSGADLIRFGLGLGRHGLGLSLHSYRYHLDQEDFVLPLTRTLEEDWSEWTFSLGLGYHFTGFQLRYLSLITLGTGRPGVDQAFFRGTPEVGANTAFRSDFIIAPNGPLSLQAARVWMPHITLLIPITD